MNETLPPLGRGVVWKVRRADRSYIRCRRGFVSRALVSTLRTRSLRDVEQRRCIHRPCETRRATLSPIVPSCWVEVERNTPRTRWTDLGATRRNARRTAPKKRPANTGAASYGDERPRFSRGGLVP